MDIRKLLSSNTSSPLAPYQGQTNQPRPSVSPAVVAAAPPKSVRVPSEPSPEIEEPAIPASVDPHVAGFLQTALGTRKWRIFASKLCERRDPDAPPASRANEAGGTSGPKAKAKRMASVNLPEVEDGVLHGGTSPCAIAFLVKVEVVKEVLRNYVPNPYHPTKVESHPYPPAPGGFVHVTRASVLALCQWSNTQFAYWSRRSEAVSVLACHDSGLRDLFYVLFERLYQRPPPPNAFAAYSPVTTSTSWSSTASSCGSPPPSHSKQPSISQSHQRDIDVVEVERRLRVARSFTGKGLDGVIAEVKKRTGASQFLRGRQSSLDPFGAYLTTGAAAYDPNWPVVMPSFHGKQSHSRASSDNYDHLTTSMPSGLLTSSRASSGLGSPMMSLPRPSYDASNERLYDRRLASSMPGYDHDFRFPTRLASSPAGSDSPYSRSSTAGSKRKRDDSSSSDEDEPVASADLRRLARPRAVSDYAIARSALAKRAKRDI
ncbi:SubName: Full=Uncharacterized protein {ECO:0000313/EMBL:CCA71069.1} [Serendipita indica DSM 11827]|nr:SubName: Full=Uncharacterized protein {ECO:0000313/EMBL:CCA71069.1} [Serendipita indica DSM 11827]